MVSVDLKRWVNGITVGGRVDDRKIGRVASWTLSRMEILNYWCERRVARVLRLEISQSFTILNNDSYPHVSATSLAIVFEKDLPP